MSSVTIMTITMAKAMYAVIMAAEATIAAVINNQAPPLLHCFVAEGVCFVQISGCIVHESNARRSADRQ